MSIDLPEGETKLCDDLGPGGTCRAHAAVGVEVLHAARTVVPLCQRCKWNPVARPDDFYCDACVDLILDGEAEDQVICHHRPSRERHVEPGLVTTSCEDCGALMLLSVEEPDSP